MSNKEGKRSIEDSCAKSKKLKSDYIVDQDFINYLSIPTLESIAIVTVATQICMQSDVRDAIREHSLEFDPVGGSISCIRGDSHSKSFKKIKNSFLTKLSFVPLPNLLKAKVANIYAPVVSQILQWIRYGRKDEEYIDSVYWTIHGTIDKVKTFEKLVNKDSAQFHIKSFFELACRFCLEDSIFILWNKLPKTLQNVYYKKAYRKYENHLIAYWISIVKNELSGLFGRIKHYDPNDIYSCNSSVYKNMFTLAVQDGNISAVKYFWNKLTNEEIVSNLAHWIKYSLHNRKSVDKIYQNIYDNSEVLFFLLSQMDHSSQQKEIFEEHSKVILLSLFNNWPWQRFLLPTIQKIWLSLDQKVYIDLLSNIVFRIEESKTTHQLLRKLWQNSPVDLKKCFIQYIMRLTGNTDVICNLLTVGDIGTIILILSYANVEEKKHIIFSVVKNYKLREVIYKDKLSLFDTLLSDTLSSESDIEKLKEKIALECGNAVGCDWVCEDNFQMLEKFLKWAFTSQDQIDNFKNKVLDKMQVTFKILKDLRNYKLVDKFISWFLNNEQEIDEFKKNFAKSKCEIVTIGEENWGEFEKFMCWCFISNEDIQDFRCSILESDQLPGIIFDQIVYGYNFEFIDKLIAWCCTSDEQIKQFKEEFVLSYTCLGILQRFVSNYKVYNNDYNNWELTKKLLKLFFPLEENITFKLKDIIRKEIDFNDFYWAEDSYQIEKKDLFRLIDNKINNTDDDHITSDSDDSGTGDERDEP